MAGDWIKMGTGLRTHPKIVRISSALDADRYRVIGGLHAVWSLFDAHSEDGVLVGYTGRILDEEIGWPGFTAALIAVGWCDIGDESLVLPRFDAHNGQSAKRRAMEADRKRTVRKTSAPDADKKRTREEKNREEIKSTRAPSSAPQTDALTLTSPPVSLEQHKAERIAQVTQDAIETFNASPLVKPQGGLLATVSPKVGRENRIKQVKRCVRVARSICEENYGGTTITRQFWVDYWAECERDDFMAGRVRGGKGHENWLPDFEFLTKDETMLKVYDRAAAEDAA